MNSRGHRYNLLYGLKTTETLLGIETRLALVLVFLMRCLKTTETLLGIETLVRDQAEGKKVIESQNY